MVRKTEAGNNSLHGAQWLENRAIHTMKMVRKMYRIQEWIDMMNPIGNESHHNLLIHSFVMICMFPAIDDTNYKMSIF